MPHFSQAVKYRPSKNADDRIPVNKNADCLKCMSGHSMFKKEKEEKKKILKDKDLFVIKGNKKSNNIIKKNKNNGRNTKKNSKSSSKLKRGIIKNIQKQTQKINGDDERKRRKFDRFINKYK